MVTGFVNKDILLGNQKSGSLYSYKNNNLSVMQ